MSAVIEAYGLTKLFSGGRGVRDIHLQVDKGQIFGFLGPNGAGKSTFVKMLVGLLRPIAGEARVLGLPLGELEMRTKIGYLPELFRYQDWLTAEEVLRFHARLCKLEKSHRERRIQEVIRDVGIEDRSHDRVRGFSKGMQQRLGIACALLSEPEVLFLDEPASALDPGGRHEVRTLLSRLQNQGVTIFLNTHLLEDVEAVCTNVALLNHGVIRGQGAVSDILHPDSVYEFTVGGFEPALLQQLQAGIGNINLEISVLKLYEFGTAVLEARLGNIEQAAWLNMQMVSLGLSVYTIGPRKNRLESWFLELTESGGGDSA